MLSYVVGVIFLGLATTNAEVVSFSSCYPQDPNWDGNCTVLEVRISPCPQASAKKPCVLKRGEKALVEFDYVPKVSVEDDLDSRAYWALGDKDLPWVGMNHDGCKQTTCPTEKQAVNKYKYDLDISKKYPVRNFDVKWKLQKENVMECCFITKIRISK